MYISREYIQENWDDVKKMIQDGEEMKIFLTGAQGTGKTTVLNILKERLGIPVITEVARDLHKNKGVVINEMGGEETQKLIFDTYMQKFKENNCFISDRGLTDVISYTKDAVDRGLIDKKVWDEQFEAWKGTFRKWDSYYIYFPVLFGVEDDGVRSVDEVYRDRIDSNIVNLLDSNMDYMRVSLNTPEERANMIVNYIAGDYDEENCEDIYEPPYFL